jgi:hypothetical protein
MPGDWADADLLKSTDETAGPAPQRRRTGALILIAVLIAVVGAAWYVGFGNWTLGRRESTAAAPTTAAPPATDRPLGADPLSVTIPPLDESDAVVAELLAKLSSHPRVAAWLATKGLIRNFTVVVTNIGEGKAPSSLVPTLRPSSAFSVIQRGSTTYVDPRSYERYAPLADAVASVDPAGSARLYATLKPRIEEAYRDLGTAEPLFDHTLERAIILLLKTPVLNDPVALKPKGLGYAYADERLEDLTAAQKQLLRTGPQNTRTIQRSLRAIGLALGIPADRLPAVN